MVAWGWGRGGVRWRGMEGKNTWGTRRFLGGDLDFGINKGQIYQAVLFKYDQFTVHELYLNKYNTLTKRVTETFE